MILGLRDYPHHRENLYGHTSICNISMEPVWGFYLLIEELGRFFEVWYSYSQATQWNQKTPIPVSASKITGQF